MHRKAFPYCEQLHQPFAYRIAMRHTPESPLYRNQRFFSCQIIWINIYSELWGPYLVERQPRELRRSARQSSEWQKERLPSFDREAARKSPKLFVSSDEEEKKPKEVPLLKFTSQPSVPKPPNITSEGNVTPEETSGFRSVGANTLALVEY